MGVQNLVSRVDGARWGVVQAENGSFKLEKYSTVSWPLPTAMTQFS